MIYIAVLVGFVMGFASAMVGVVRDDRRTRMSLHSYHVSQAMMKHDPPFYALIMAAMRKADDNNLAKLKAAWPAVWIELKERHENTLGVTEADGPVDIDILLRQIESLKL